MTVRLTSNKNQGLHDSKSDSSRSRGVVVVVIGSSSGATAEEEDEEEEETESRQKWTNKKTWTFRLASEANRGFSGNPSSTHKETKGLMVFSG